MDIQEESKFGADEVAEALDLDDETGRYLATPNDRTVFNDHGRYIHITTYAPREDDEGELHAVECVVGQNWVVTAHDRPIPVLDEFAERVSGSGATGLLDGPTFLAADEDIEVLIEMRREVGKLRRALAAHRFALVALMHPELEALGDKASGERFGSLFARFEATLQESRDVREAIVGSFDVLIARAGHQTNEIMKVLTLASVILLPGSLLAGVMGMNFKVDLFDNASLFWVVVAVIVAVAPLTIGAAKHWRWI